MIFLATFEPVDYAVIGAAGKRVGEGRGPPEAGSAHVRRVPQSHLRPPPSCPPGVVCRLHRPGGAGILPLHCALALWRAQARRRRCHRRRQERRRRSRRRSTRLQRPLARPRHPVAAVRCLGGELQGLELQRPALLRSKHTSPKGCRAGHGASQSLLPPTLPPAAVAAAACQQPVGSQLVCAARGRACLDGRRLDVQNISDGGSWRAAPAVRLPDAAHAESRSEVRMGAPPGQPRLHACRMRMRATCSASRCPNACRPVALAPCCPQPAAPPRGNAAPHRAAGGAGSAVRAASCGGAGSGGLAGAGGAVPGAPRGGLPPLLAWVLLRHVLAGHAAAVRHQQRRGSKRRRRRHGRSSGRRLHDVRLPGSGGHRARGLCGRVSGGAVRDVRPAGSSGSEPEAAPPPARLPGSVLCAHAAGCVGFCCAQGWHRGDGTPLQRGHLLPPRLRACCPCMLGVTRAQPTSRSVCSLQAWAPRAPAWRGARSLGPTRPAGSPLWPPRCSRCCWLNGKVRRGGEGLAALVHCGWRRHCREVAPLHSSTAAGMGPNASQQAHEASGPGRSVPRAHPCALLPIPAVVVWPVRDLRAVDKVRAERCGGKEGSAAGRAADWRVGRQPGLSRLPARCTPLRAPTLAPFLARPPPPVCAAAAAPVGRRLHRCFSRGGAGQSVQRRQLIRRRRAPHKVAWPLGRRGGIRCSCGGGAHAVGHSGGAGAAAAAGVLDSHFVHDTALADAPAADVAAAAGIAAAAGRAAFAAGAAAFAALDLPLCSGAAVAGAAAFTVRTLPLTVSRTGRSNLNS